MLKRDWQIRNMPKINEFLLNNMQKQTLNSVVNTLRESDFLMENLGKKQKFITKIEIICENIQFIQQLDNFNSNFNSNFNNQFDIKYSSAIFFIDFPFKSESLQYNSIYYIEFMMKTQSFSWATEMS